MKFAGGFQQDPIAEGSAEALVVLLHDHGAAAAAVAARWAASVPTTAFIALDGINRAEPTSGVLLPPRTLDLDVSTQPTVLDHAAGHLKPLLEQQLRSYGLDADRLVLAGFGQGGTLALHLVLRQGWSCAGVLAFAARLAPNLPRNLGVDCKVRLIECVENRPIDPSNLRAVVTLLTARGIDTRGASLTCSILSDEAVRHGGAYLAELVATAQRGHRFHRNQEGSHA